MQDSQPTLRVEYVTSGKISTDENNKCCLCKFEYDVITTCCQKKLCEWHVRQNGEHADQNYYSCNFCEENEPYGENGYIRKIKTIYCDEHNEMTYCENCEGFVCDNHKIHKCVEWISIPDPVFNEDEMKGFIANIS